LRRSSPSVPDVSLRASVRDQAGYSLAELLVVVAVTGFLMAAVFTIYQVTQRTAFRASGSEASLVQARAIVDKFGGDFRMVGAARNLYSAPISAATGTSLTFQGDIDNTLATDYSPVTVSGSQVNANAASMTVSDATNILCGTDITLADGPVTETHTLPAAGCKTGNTITFGTTNCPDASGAGGDRPCTFYPVGSFVYTVETIYWVWDAASGNLCRKINTACNATPSLWDQDNDVIASGVTNFSLTYLDRTGTTLAMSGTPPALPTTSYSSVRAVRVSVTVSGQSGDQTVTRQMELTARARALVP
jgi:prepilin-type N-terminal cleavage/methylation domain-containing protein